MSRIIVDSIRNSSASSDGITLSSDGKVAFPNGGAGKILSVTQTVKTDTFSESNVAQGSQSGDAIYLDFAATSGSNKLLVHYSLSAGSSAANRMGCLFVVGGVIQSGFIGDADGNRKQVTSTAANQATWAINNLAGSLLVSSPSTNSTRYSFRLVQGDNTTHTVYLNRSHDDNNQSYMHRPISTITIMEVAA